MSITWIEKARRGGNVQRMHTEPTLQPYNNAIHTFNAIIIAKEICYSMAMEDTYITDYLLVHDLPEEWLGDMPAPAKKDCTMNKCMTALEGTWYSAHLPQHYDLDGMLTDADMALIKCADYLELCNFCLTEMEMGNRAIRHVYENSSRYIMAQNELLQSELVTKLDSEFYRRYTKHVN